MREERRHLPSRIPELRALAPSLRRLADERRAVPLLYLEITGLDGLRADARRAALRSCKRAVAAALAASAGSVLRRGDVVAAGPDAAWFAALLVDRAVDAPARAAMADADIVVAAMRLRSAVLAAFLEARPVGSVPRRAGVRAGWTVVEPIASTAPLEELRHAVRGAAVVARVEERRATFLASVTHELRTPLTAIIGYVEQLRGSRRLGSQRSRRYLSIVASEAERLARLVEGLIDAGAWGAGSLRLEVASHDLGELADGAWRCVEPRHSARALIYSRRGSAIADVDPERMHQILMNLLDNAARHTKRYIIAKVASRAGQTRIAVDDDGDGFTQETLREFGRPFAVGPGGQLGLGLSIARLLVEAHGGTLRAARRRGGGASVVARLPTRAQER